MRVTLCVDALQPQLSGIGRYTWELCNRLPLQDDVSRLQYYRGQAIVEEPGRFLERGSGATRRGDIRWVQRLRVQRALRTSLVHGPNYFLPHGVETGVVTVHDLSVFRYPETHPKVRVDAFERLFQSSLRRASHVITDTDTVRRELIETLSVPAGMVSSIPLGGGDPLIERGTPLSSLLSLADWALSQAAMG